MVLVQNSRAVISILNGPVHINGIAHANLEIVHFLKRNKNTIIKSNWFGIFGVHACANV